MKRIILCIAVAVTITGCAPSVYDLTDEEQHGITYEIFDEEREEVFSAALAQVQSGTAVIDYVDEDAGIINTDWMQEDSALQRFLVGGQRARLSLSITEEGEDQTRLFVRLSMQSQGSFGSWEEYKVTEELAEEHITPFLADVRERLED